MLTVVPTLENLPSYLLHTLLRYTIPGDLCRGAA